MLTHEEQELDKAEWSEIRTKSVVIPLEDFGKLKKYYLKVCKKGC